MPGVYSTNRAVAGRLLCDCTLVWILLNGLSSSLLVPACPSEPTTECADLPCIYCGAELGFAADSNAKTVRLNYGQMCGGMLKSKDV